MLAATGIPSAANLMVFSGSRSMMRSVAAELLDNLLELFRLHLVAGLLLDALHRIGIVEALLYDSQVVEVCQPLIDAPYRSVYLLYFAFVFSHLAFTI